MRHLLAALLVLGLGHRPECAGASPPALAVVSPNSVFERSPALKITLTGSDFTSASEVLLDFEKLATKLESPTELSAVIPASRLMTAGILQIGVSGPGGPSNTIPFYVLSSSAPSISSISPLNGQAGLTVAATLSGNNLLGATAVTFSGTGITVSVGTGTPTSLPISIVISGAAARGARSFTVTTLAGTSAPYSGFVIGDPPAPTVTEGEMLPLFGKTLKMTVHGHFFNSDSKVWVNGITLPSTFINESQLDAMVPGLMMMSPGSLPLQVKTSTLSSNTASLRVVQRGDANGDQKVNIGDALAMALAAGGSKPPLINSVGDINLNGVANIGDALVVALFAGGLTANLPVPSIISGNPPGVARGKTLSLVTMGMPGEASNYRILFRNIDGDLVSVAPVLVSVVDGKWNVVVPETAVSGFLQVEQLDPPLVGAEFPLLIENVEAPLALISVNPFVRVGSGASIVLNGTGFDSNPAANSVRFRGLNGTITGTVTSATSTSLTVTVPADAQCGPVTVSVGGKTSNARSITTSGTQCPLMLADIAGAGSPGDILILDGVGFDTATPSNNVVRFQSSSGTTVATVLQAGLTKLYVRIPDDAVDGDITVSLNTQTSNPLHYHPAKTVP